MSKNTFLPVFLLSFWLVCERLCQNVAQEKIENIALGLLSWHRTAGIYVTVCMSVFSFENNKALGVYVSWQQ